MTKEYYNAHRDEIKSRQKEYYRSHRKEFLARARKQHRTARYREYHKRYYEKHREELRQKAKLRYVFGDDWKNHWHGMEDSTGEEAQT